MSQALDAILREQGTKFLIYPQHKSLKGFEKPEIVYINAKPGTIKPGPADDRMYVVDAINKQPYCHTRPPYSGKFYPPVESDANGHFDHIRPYERAFAAVTMYATVRRTLDIWEDYFGRKIPWIFRSDYARLELIPRMEYNNAFSGYGYLEFGFPCKDGGVCEGSPCTPGKLNLDYDNPYCENFDVLAHEMGHAIKNGVIGRPKINATKEYSAHHEAFADLVAIVASMHFDSVINTILENTKGNLFSINELSRLGELSQNREIRIVFNYTKMSDVKNPNQEHWLSLPFTGGAFDTLVEIYEHNLIEQGTIPAELGKRSYNAKGEEIPGIQKEFERHYQQKPEEFRQALINARDYFGALMALAWSKTSPEYLRFIDVVQNMIDADDELTGGKYGNVIRGSFAWREINTLNDPDLLSIWSISECMAEIPSNEGVIESFSELVHSQQ